MIIETLDSTGLRRLEALGPLAARSDRTYIVPSGVADALLERLSLTTTVLEVLGSRRHRLDTIALVPAAGGPAPFVARSRLYHPGDTSVLEAILLAARGVRRMRIAQAPDLHGHVGPVAAAALAEFVNHLPALTPGRWTTRSRVTLAATGTRVSIDTALMSDTWRLRSGLAVIRVRNDVALGDPDRVLAALGVVPVLSHSRKSTPPFDDVDILRERSPRSFTDG